MVHLEGAQIDTLHRLDHEVPKIIRREPVPKIGRKQKRLVPITLHKVAHAAILREIQPKPRLLGACAQESLLGTFGDIIRLPLKVKTFYGQAPRESLNNPMFAVSSGRGGLDVRLDDIADRPGAALVTGYGANRRYPRRSASFPAVPPAAGRLLPCHPVA